MIFGYARVSTAIESFEPQIAALKAAWCEHVVTEIAAPTDLPPGLCRLIDQLARDDELIVTRLDRVAVTSTGAISVMTKTAGKGAGFHPLDHDWHDRSTDDGQLLAEMLGWLREYYL